MSSPSAPRVNDQRLVELRELSNRQRAEREAQEAQRDSLVTLRRSDEYSDLAVGYIAARAARAALAQRELARQAARGRDGAASAADVDRLRAEAEIADRELAAAEAGFAALRLSDVERAIASTAARFACRSRRCAAPGTFGPLLRGLPRHQRALIRKLFTGGYSNEVERVSIGRTLLGVARKVFA
jgi:hypothetical protein